MSSSRTYTNFQNMIKKETKSLIILVFTALIRGLMQNVLTGFVQVFSPEFSDLIKGASTFGGAVMGVILSEVFGRRMTLGICDNLLLCAIPFTGMGTHPFKAYIGPGLLALVSGVQTVVVPIYCAEKAPPKRRPLMITAINIGLGMGTYSTSLIDLESVLFLVLALILMVFTQNLIVGCLHDTPHYLMQKGNLMEAWLSIEETHLQVHDRFYELKAVASPSKEETLGHLLYTIKEKSNFRSALLAGVTTQAASQLCGQQLVLFLKPMMMEACKIPTSLEPIITLVFEVIAQSLCLKLLSTFRTKNLMMVSYIALGLNLSVLGLVCYFIRIGLSNMVINSAGLFLLVMYLVIYEPLGAAPWLLQVEMYPPWYLTLGGGCGSVVRWAANLTVTANLIQINKAVEIYNSLGMFGISSILCAIAIYLWVKEKRNLAQDLEAQENAAKT